MDYKKYIKYLYSIKQFIIIASALLLFSTIYGYFGAQSSPEEARTALAEFEKIFTPIIQAAPIMQFIFIFLNNAFSLFLSIISGITFGILPLIALFSNGMIIGVFAFLWQQEFALSEFLMGILPHGIIEIPVLIVGCAIGLKIGREVINKVFKKQGQVKPEIKSGLNFFLKIMLPLVLIASAIEVFITPLFF